MLNVSVYREQKEETASQPQEGKRTRGTAVPQPRSEPDEEAAEQIALGRHHGNGRVGHRPRVVERGRVDEQVHPRRPEEGEDEPKFPPLLGTRQRGPRRDDEGGHETRCAEDVAIEDQEGSRWREEEDRRRGQVVLISARRTRENEGGRATHQPSRSGRLRRGPPPV